MLVYGVLKERGKWTSDSIRRRVFKCTNEWTTVCQSEEEAREKAYDMWESLALSDKKTTRITATKRDISNEEVEEIEENYGADTKKEIEEIAVSENYDVIEIYSMEEKEEEND